MQAFMPPSEISALVDTSLAALQILCITKYFRSAATGSAHKARVMIASRDSTSVTVALSDSRSVHAHRAGPSYSAPQESLCRGTLPHISTNMQLGNADIMMPVSKSVLQSGFI